MLPGGVFREAAIFPMFYSPEFIAAAPDHSVWVILHNDNSPIYEQALVHRLVDGTNVHYELPRDWSHNVAGASSMVVDRSGAVWIALNELFGGALIAKLDAQ